MSFNFADCLYWWEDALKDFTGATAYQDTCDPLSKLRWDSSVSVALKAEFLITGILLYYPRLSESSKELWNQS